MKKLFKIILFIIFVLNLICTIAALTGNFDLLTKLNAITFIATIVSVIGLWLYRKWGVYLYVSIPVLGAVLFLFQKPTFSDYSPLFVHVVLISPVIYLWKEFK
jgi:hypothetical protein